MKVTDPRLQSMVDLVKKYRRGYDQEGYIIEENLSYIFQINPICLAKIHEF